MTNFNILITSTKENNRVCKPLKPLRIYFRPQDETSALIFFLAHRRPSTIQCASLDEITHPGIMSSELKKPTGDLQTRYISNEGQILCSLEALSDRKLPQLQSDGEEHRIETDEGSYILDIPPFQRGLVWNPAQIEVLWDSLMRGIPIGTITLIGYKENSSYKQGNTNATHGIFDGQQRFHAISLGIKTQFLFAEEPSSLLWLDLLPEFGSVQSCSRKFFLYLTTPGQPWGYRINDGESETRNKLLDAADRSRALEEINFGGDPVKEKPTPQEMWPVKAGLPVPLAFLWHLREKNQGITMESITEPSKQFCKESDRWHEYFCKEPPWYKHFCKEIKDSNKREKLECNLKNYINEGLRVAHTSKVVVSIVPETFNLKKDDENDQTADSDIAVFFSRLNRSGTLPSQEDINYSILKSIVPELVQIDKIAENRMRPARLATISMRFYFAVYQKEWRNDIKRKDVFELSQKREFKEFINNFAEKIERFEKMILYPDTLRSSAKSISQGEDLISRKWGLPKFILSLLYGDQAYTSIYLLLLYLSTKAKEENMEFCQTLAAFSMLSVCFATEVGKRRKRSMISIICSQAYKNFAEDTEIQTDHLRRFVYKCFHNDWLIQPPPLRVYENISKAAENMAIDKLEKAWSDPLYNNGIDRTWNVHSKTGCIFLLYACRKYIETRYDYNPADAAYNEENRPWDYDHIFPKAWVEKGSGEYVKYAAKMKDCIGNLAPIPFMINRSKQDEAPYSAQEGKSEYQEYKDDLFSDFPAYVEINTSGDLFKDFEINGSFLTETPTSSIWDNKKNSFQLFYFIAKRLEKLYEEFYTELKIESFFSFAEEDERKDLFKEFKESFLKGLRESSSKKLPPDLESKIHIWANLDSGHQVKVDQTDERTYARSWLSCGIEVELIDEGEKALLCMCCGSTNNPSLEFGLRRHPEKTEINNNSDRWWWDRGKGENLDINKIVGKLVKLSETHNCKIL